MSKKKIFRLHKILKRPLNIKPMTYQLSIKESGHPGDSTDPHLPSMVRNNSPDLLVCSLFGLFHHYKFM